jgi:hypothetical protein
VPLQVDVGGEGLRQAGLKHVTFTDVNAGDDVVLPLELGKSIKGTVTGSPGAPADLVVFVLTHDRRGLDCLVLSERVDRSGAFNVGGLGDGTYDLLFYTSDSALPLGYVGGVQAGANVVARLGDLAELSGQVAAAPRASIELWHDERAYKAGSFSPREDGTFSVLLPATMPCTVVALTSEGVAIAGGVKAPAEIELQLVAEIDVRGRIAGLGSRALVVLNAPSYYRYVAVEPGQEFGFRVPPGAYDLEVRKPAYRVLLVDRVRGEVGVDLALRYRAP